MPKLITLACYPSNISAIVPLSKAATEKALKVLSLGKVPSLSDFHHMRKYKSRATWGQVLTVETQAVVSMECWDGRLAETLQEWWVQGEGPDFRGMLQVPSLGHDGRSTAKG